MRFSLLVTVALFCAASLPHCMRVTDGIEVDVAYQPAATPASVRTDMGYRVRLERAMMAVGKVELIKCDHFVLDLWRLVTPGRARAHEFSSPTSLGVPVVIDLMESAGVPLFAGTMRPPPGRYCGIRIVGMPADEDAEGLTDENLEMMQHSVLIAGQVEDESTGDETLLLAQIGEVLQYELLFDRALVFDSPVLESVSIQIDHTKWFDGIDFALQSPDAVQQQITRNVRSSLQAILPEREADL
ncbi:MAG: hypothetical protein JRG67_16020 [Deltaproteobacteria bacterium]|nr:hypothetical protein [Deltaproteobacteria bacterium]MBW1906123.1 hypothetical protein [Deltaproteobacteria bacterium]MBW2212513.1 hypothetical protein [Deltaproteobacteria bacterium]MBW2380654.1 hypothetical protein [Deltaproteobacteria bacterium]MBW2551745.1 hypothetical protein [Deltaproteobacteria bacterium]